MYFSNENNYFDYDFNDYLGLNSNIINYNRELSNDVFNSFNDGNYFKDSFSKYKNHSYKLKVNNEKDKLLLSIQSYCFVLKDLNLYLDIHPNDTTYLSKFLKYKDEYEKLCKEFTLKYGPLEITNVNSNNRWIWLDNSWPWDKGDK